MFGLEHLVGGVHRDKHCCKSLSCSKRVQSVSFNGGHHGNNGHLKGVVKNDVVFKCSHCGDGTNQRLDV